MYGRDLGPTGDPTPTSPTDSETSPFQMKIDVQGVRELYECYIIPLTKEVEVILSVQSVGSEK